MEKLQEIFQEISELTNTIETNYPELYHFLDETPSTISSTEPPEIGVEIMQNYLETLKELLRRHLETRKTNL